MNPNNSIIEPAHHEHRGRTIGIVLTLLALVVIGAILYQMIVLRRASLSRDQVLRQNFESSTTAQSSDFFKKYDAKPMTDAERKSAAEFSNANPATEPTDAELKQWATEYEQADAAAFAAYKSEQK